MRMPVFLMAGLAAMLGCSAFAAPTLPANEAYTAAFVQDRARVQDVVAGLANATDKRQWNEVQLMLADRIHLRYASADGSHAPIDAVLTPDQFVQASQTQLPGFLHTQHLISNLIVDVAGDKAQATSQVWMTHYLPNGVGEAFWVVGALYEHELVRTPTGWKISAMRVNKLYELGNRQLQALAAERVKAGKVSTGP